MPVRLPGGITLASTVCWWIFCASWVMRSGVSSMIPPGGCAKPGWVGEAAWQDAQRSAITCCTSASVALRPALPSGARGMISTASTTTIAAAAAGSQPIVCPALRRLK